MSKLSIFVVAAIVVLAGAGILASRVFAADDTQMPAVGQQAPDFTLTSQEGKPVSLSSFHGKWVVLYFYPKDMTSGCTREAHAFQRDQEKFQKVNATIVGVSVDSVQSHKEFCAKDGLNFTLLSDEEKKVVAEYGSLGNYAGFKIANRNTFLIDPNGKIAKVWTKVNPDGHSEEVLTALNQMEAK